MIIKTNRKHIGLNAGIELETRVRNTVYKSNVVIVKDIRSLDSTGSINTKGLIKES